MKRLPKWLAEEWIPLTVPEVRRLVWRLVWDRVAAEPKVTHWSAWRRRHQARARRSHWMKRLARPPT